MPDIDLYREAPEKYHGYQSTRPDYSVANDRAIELVARHLVGKTNVAVADFCCGIGSNTLTLANKLGGIKKALLIDINETFLAQAKKSNIKTRELVVTRADILEAKIDQEYNCVLSLFAYHHVANDQKQRYIDQVKAALKPDGLLVLAEIYLPDRATTRAYYDKLIQAIPADKRSPGLIAFLEQTARSQDFEFKVSRTFAADQLTSSGFTCLVEERIWPQDDELGEDVGTFVQIWLVDQR